MTLQPTTGSSLLASVLPFAGATATISSSGTLTTPRPEASVTASASATRPIVGAYTATSFVNAIQTVTEDSASRFSMTFYSGTTYSVSALGILDVYATSQVTWSQILNLSTESLVTLTHVSTPRFGSDLNPVASVFLAGVSNPGFAAQSLTGLTGVSSGVSFMAPAGTYLFGSIVNRNAFGSSFPGGSAVTDTFQSITVTPVPEPASGLLMLGGALALLAWRRSAARPNGSPAA